MKKFKKIAGFLLAAIMVIAMAVPAMAAPATKPEGKRIVISPSKTVPILDDSVFTAYKILDVASVAGDEIAYTVPADMKAFYLGRYTDLTGTEGDFAYQVAKQIEAEQKAAESNPEGDLYAFAKAASEYVAGKVTGTTGKKQTDGTYVIEELSAGYYIIVDTSEGTNNGEAIARSAIMMDTNVEEVSVTLKADQPPLTKKIDGEHDSDPSSPEEPVDKNNVAVGDKVPYVITSTVPTMNGYKKYNFVITDTLTKGLDYNEDLEITIGGEKVDSVKYDLTVSEYDATKGTTITIVFKDFLENWQDKAGEEIKVTYTATVNDNAVIGVEGNPNTATLEYSNDPSIVPDGDTFPDDDERHGKTPESTVISYVTGLELEKVDKDGNTLTGAQFTLTGTRLNRVKVTGFEFQESADGTYYKLTDGTYTEQEPSESTTDEYVSTTKKYAKVDIEGYVDKDEEIKVTAEVGADGKLVFEGLAAGTYTIKEIKAPDGFNLLVDPIEVTITASYDDDGCTWSGTSDGQTITFDGTSGRGILTGLKIVNNSGTRLPSTGGMGTTILYVIGGILVLSAAVVLVSKKRAAK